MSARPTPSQRLARLALLLLCCTVLVGPVRADEEAAPAELQAPAAKPKASAIDRGVAYLLEAQNKDGSWGTPASTLHDIYAPIPGSQQAFHVASTALATSGLIATGRDDEAVTKAIRRAADWLVEHHAVKRVSQNTLYNTWAHAYALAAFARLIERESDDARKAQLRAAAALAVDRLSRFEFVEGGWGYYDFNEKARNPGRGSTSFTTATGLHALKQVSEQGVAVPERLVSRGLRVLRMTRKPDNAYAYAVKHRYYPHMGVNKVKGSLARTPACVRALLDWTSEPDKRERAVRAGVQALKDLETHGHFLRIARKYPIPHETWYQNSGYFCFYGYYYATELLPDLPAAKRKTFARQIQGHLERMQEKDGSFWDYQLFTFHKAYGTGYVLLALSRCRDVLAG